MLKVLWRYLFPRRDKFMSEKDLQEYMRIEHVTYYDIFPPTWRDKVDGDPRVKRGK